MIYEPRLPIIFIYQTSYQLYMLSKLDFLPTHNFLFIYKNCHNQASYDKNDHGISGLEDAKGLFYNSHGRRATFFVDSKQFWHSSDGSSPESDS